MRRAAVVGHSQVPRIVNINEADVRVFRKPGARIHHFDEFPLNEILEFRPEVTVLFLGGNDINNEENCVTNVAAGLKRVIEILRNINSVVIFVEIEWRDFNRSPVPNLTSETYNQKRKTINRNLKRYCNSRKIRTINTSSVHLERVGRDLVHFDNLAARHVKAKIERALSHAVGEMEA